MIYFPDFKFDDGRGVHHRKHFNRQVHNGRPCRANRKPKLAARHQGGGVVCGPQFQHAQRFGGSGLCVQLRGGQAFARRKLLAKDRLWNI